MTGLSIIVSFTFAALVGVCVIIPAVRWREQEHTRRRHARLLADRRRRLARYEPVEWSGEVVEGWRR